MKCRERTLLVSSLNAAFHIIRPHTKGVSYKLVRECYMHSMMNRGAMNWVDGGQ